MPTTTQKRRLRVTRTLGVAAVAALVMSCDKAITQTEALLPLTAASVDASAADHIRDAQMSEVCAARTFALLNMAMHDASVASWEAKYFYFNRRPSQLDAQIKTDIGLPNFPGYPSGHSTFSAAAASVLSYVFPGSSTEFTQMADEAGMSRLYGGIHIRSDIQEGKAHGARVGAFSVRRAQADGAP